MGGFCLFIHSGLPCQLRWEGFLLGASCGGCLADSPGRIPVSLRGAAGGGASLVKPNPNLRAIPGSLDPGQSATERPQRASSATRSRRPQKPRREREASPPPQQPLAEKRGPTPDKQPGRKHPPPQDPPGGSWGGPFAVLILVLRRNLSKGTDDSGSD